MDTTVRKPNVLFILTDDQRFDTIGALGNPHIHTPNLDQLVRQGFAFEKEFCTTPICTPARAEILTGCDSFRNRVPWFGLPINPDLTLLPQAFQRAGFHTIHVGKWHNDGHPRDKGYERTRRVFPSDNLNEYRQRGHWMRFNEEGTETEGHSTELFTEAALEELAAAPADRPWFCCLAYTAPHDPHDSPPPFDTMYDPGTMPLFPNHMPEHPIDNGAMIIRDELLENWPRTHDVMRRYRCRYYGMISHLDHHIGRLLGRLRATGQLENTLIVFTGDQGLAVGSHGLLGKENMYDHSIASPLIFCGPGVPAGGRSWALSHHVDLFPTLCELAGIETPPSAQDGHSLAPIMHGEAERVRDAILCEFCIPRGKDASLAHVQRAVRTERWKLVWYADPRRFQLFDLQRDADEVVHLLAPWRRELWRVHAGTNRNPAWKKGQWAGADQSPPYTEAQIDAVAMDLWKRMLELMDAQNDPLPAERRPPSPLAPA
ncbi:MAG: sulfatase-like hydrolase/transferase [Kiritimatiellaeota bacterium]|nr:sulfatase-like hydrolase/transferase [Kiritimatiellota bacterium]